MKQKLSHITLSLLHFVTFALLIITACNSKKTNALHENQCKKFETGTFYNKNKDYKIVRFKNKQIEYDLTNNSQYHFEVHRLYGCAYNLTYKFSKNPQPQFNLKQEDMLRVQIIEVEKNKTISEIEFEGKKYQQTFYLEE